MDKCDFSLVQKILESGETVNIGEQDIVIKAIPDSDKSGVMDGREFFIRSAIYAFQKSVPMKFSVEGMRMTTKTYSQDCCTKEIREDAFEIDSKGRTVKVFSYVLADKDAEMIAEIINLFC